jgi:tungstate transport system substrate-binding protein
MIRRSLTLIAAIVGASMLLAACGGSDTLILATTTSTENSGLLDELVPLFEQESSLSVKVIAVGSGAALALGERGDADVLLVHAPEAEQALVAAGHGIERARVMFNDFVLVGPPSDPAAISGGVDAASALQSIEGHAAAFVSRGDDSGTHQKERALWAAASLPVPTSADWYAETGQGMGATLTVAAETQAYMLSDRATWLVVTDASVLPIHVEGDDRLRNVYHVIVVNPAAHGDVNSDGARQFRAFLLRAEIQQRIGAFGVDEFGQALFTPDAE